MRRRPASPSRGRASTRCPRSPRSATSGTSRAASRARRATDPSRRWSASARSRRWRWGGASSATERTRRTERPSRCRPRRSGLRPTCPPTARRATTDMTKRSNRIVLPVERSGVSRRSYLRAAGFRVAAATLSACSRAPVRSIVSSLAGTEGLAAGRAYHIATTCGGCPAACGVLAKCVDGRPVKLEGLPGHPVSAGGLCAVGQAQVLSLYDGKRLAAPLVAGAKVAWDAADAAVRGRIDAANGRVRLLTGTVHSPSTRAWIAEFEKRHGAKHVAYDALSSSSIADAHRETHGVRALPRYRFDRARVIAAFGADFLGTWISPVEFTAQWRAGRALAPGAAASSKHWQVEARTSTTGLRADRRVRLAPWETADALAELHAALGGSIASRAWVNELASELSAARGASLVVCDDAEAGAQAIVNAINERLGNYGAATDLAAPR